MKHLAALAVAAVVCAPAAHAESSPAVAARGVLRIAARPLEELPTPTKWRDLAPPGFHVHLAEAERLLIDDAADGRLDCHGLFEAALVAGGTLDEAGRDDCLARYAVWRRAASQISAEPRQERARALFEYLREGVLTGDYDTSASSLAKLVETGDYNCITATAIFVSLAREAGLVATPIEATAHAYCSLDTPDGELLLELTSTDWRRAILGPRSDAHEPRQARVVAGSAGRTDVGAAGPTRRLSDAAVAGILYYNRGVEALERAQFADAVEANLKALAVDSANTAARTNLLAASNNWSLALARNEEFERAIELLRYVRTLDRDFAPANVNLSAVHQLWIESLCRRDRHHDALGLVERLAAETRDVEHVEQLRYDVYRDWRRSLSEHGHHAEAEAVDEAILRIRQE